MIDEARKGEKPIFEFEMFRLDASKRLLFKGQEPIPLMPKAFEILLHMVERAGVVVEKNDIMDAVWPDTAVEENNLTQNISALRRALGEKHRENRFIATVPGRGYKFVAEVRKSADASNVGPLQDGLSSEVPGDFAQTPADGVEYSLSTARPKGPTPWVLGGLAVVILIVVTAAGIIYWRGEYQVAGTNRIGSIAVLPFKPLVAEYRDESLELGMADSMITKLSAGDLRVRPLAAVRRYNAVDQDPVAAGRELRVDAVLDGNIQLANGRVRISAKLIRLADGRQLWTGQYDEVSSDIFALQDSISQRVAGELQIALGDKARKNYTASVEAYQLFSKGKFHSSRLVLPEVRKGISYYEQAIAIDPTYAMAYVELSNAYRAMVLTNDARPNEVMPKARDAALRAAELDAGLAEAQTALATITFWYEFDPKRAEQLYLRALELDPDSMQSHFFYAHLLSNTGRHDEALVRIRRTLEIDPVNLVANALYGQILFFAGRLEESRDVLQATAGMDRSFWLVPLFMSRVYAKKGMWDEAAAAAAEARDLANGNAEAKATVGYAHARAGRTAEARNIINELERQSDRYVPFYALAAVYNGFGEREKALDLLERSFAERDSLMVFLKVEPKWDDLRAEPRFVELMRKMNFN